MHDLIATPFQADHLVLRPGSPKAVKIPTVKFAQLRTAVAEGATVSRWLADACTRAWGIDLSKRCADGTVLIRRPGPYEVRRAAWEINLGCD
ncbi:hypothetical protein [Streptomyces tanashiensis]|uniref:hypothetical protein n=1 Tax=Streptomyces tanashiensis TaxID=67367 RepID=UPI00343B627F